MKLTLALLLSAVASAQNYEQRIAAAMSRVDAVAEKGPFRANWGSLGAFQVPKWYQDAKFGIFIHWGVYSVPGFDIEWYPRNMHIVASKGFKHHLETYGPRSTPGSKGFI